MFSNSLNDAFGLVPQTKITILKNVKKYKTEGSSLNLKDGSDRRTERT